jgi:diketogulonate reductase-like aldo/keto reductase
MRGGVFSIGEIGDIARRHGKDPAQVTLRCVLQRGLATIPKSVHADRVRSNAQIFDFELSESEMAIIGALDRGERIGKHPDSFSV